MTLKLSDSSQSYQALQPDALHRLLNIKEIYYEPAVNDYTRGQEILSQYPDAKLIEVASHWKIPELHGNSELVEDWNRIKRTVLVLGVNSHLAPTFFDNFSLLSMKLKVLYLERKARKNRVALSRIFFACTVFYG